MAIIRHARVSIVPDESVADEIQPSDWNDDHDIISLVAADISDFTAAVEAIAGTGGATFSAATVTIPNGRGALEHEQVVSVPGVTDLQRAQVWLAPGTDADENTAEMLDMNSIAAACETGAIRFFLSFREPQSGPILLNYQVA